MICRQLLRSASSGPINWLPQSLHTGMRKIQQKLRNIDCIIEVHDARIPISGRNFELHNIITSNGVKPHILVLNKKDLTDTCDHRLIRSQLKRGVDKNVLFTSTKASSCAGLEKILPLAANLISDAARVSRFTSKDYNIMVIGLPNMGKTALITCLGNRITKASKGVRAGSRIKLQDNPPIYLFEKELELLPSVKDEETGMKLALIGCLKANTIHDLHIADYLLYWLNKHRRYEYVKVLGLAKPCDDVEQVLSDYGQQLRMFELVKPHNGKMQTIVDFEGAARKFIHLFRTGEFGAFNLDQSLNQKQC